MVSLSKPPFRGWYVAATLSVCGIALYGAGLYSFILFAKPLADEFHWSHAAVGTLVSSFWLAAPLALISDRLISRFGPRRLIISGILIEASCLIALCLASQLWEMYLLRALAGVGKILYAMTIPAILSKWFSRRFGVAVAVVYCGWHLGGVALAPLTQALIASIGWRATSVMLGIGILVIALPPTFWFLRVPSAASIGLGLDGDPLSESGASRSVDVPIKTSTRSGLGAVLRNKNFLLATLGTFIYCLSYAGVLAHQSATIEGSGISAGIASVVLGSTAFFAIAGTLLIGWLIDRYPLAWVTLVQFGVIAVGILCLMELTQVGAIWLLIAHAVLYGLGVGGTDAYWITTFKRRIPENLFVKGYGIFYFFQLAGLIVGPGFAGLLYDFSGSYTKSLAAGLANLILPFIMCLALSYRPLPDKTEPSWAL
jgi:MFS family permease